jgi:hypothetical protein
MSQHRILTGPPGKNVGAVVDGSFVELRRTDGSADKIRLDEIPPGALRDDPAAWVVDGLKLVRTHGTGDLPAELDLTGLDAPHHRESAEAILGSHQSQDLRLLMARHPRDDVRGIVARDPRLSHAAHRVLMDDPALRVRVATIEGRRRRPQRAPAADAIIRLMAKLEAEAAV